MVSTGRRSFQIEQIETTNINFDNSASLKNLRIQTYKNLLIVSAAFLLQFTAFISIEDLQTSLNTESNTGINSLLIIYAVFIFAALFLPCPLIALLGLKWTLVISQVPYLLYVAANFYPQGYLLYPAAVLVGLAAAPLWASVSSYLTDAGTFYAQETKSDTDFIVNRFFGIFYMFFQSGGICGSLIAYLVIQPQQTNGVNSTIDNDTTKSNECGASFSEQEYETSVVNNQIDQTTINILCTVYVCLCFCSILILIIFLDQRRKISPEKFSDALNESAGLFLSTMKQMRHLNQLLLIPLTMWVGLEQAYISAQFTQGFISCALNAKYVGLVFISHGICCVITSFSIPRIAKLIGRWPCFLIAGLLNYSLIITMFIWQPSKDDMPVFFIIAGLWGIGDGICQTQINAFYALLFSDNDKAAFSNYRLWESVGFVLIFAIAPYIRIRISLIILLVVLSLGMLGYGITEYRYQAKKLKSKNQVFPFS